MNLCGFPRNADLEYKPIMKIENVVSMVLVENMDRAIRFYCDTLGFTLQSEAEGWAIFEENAGLYVSPEPLPPENININAVMLTLMVEDVEQAFHELTEKGVAFLVPPTDVGGATVAAFRDTEGNLIQLMHPL